jgi:hypothetical protein
VRRKGLESSANMRFAWHAPFTGSGANDNNGCHSLSTIIDWIPLAISKIIKKKFIGLIFDLTGHAQFSFISVIECQQRFVSSQSA